MQQQNILIAGATGRQGSAVVEALLKHPDFPVAPPHLYCLTRNVSGQAAQRLLSQYPGINLVAGDLNRPEEIFEQLSSISNIAVFMAQSHGPTEVADAKAMINAALQYKVTYFVYSSVDRGGREKSDKEPTYCKTFSDKYLIEQHLRDSVKGSRMMDYTILRPTWFIDNAVWGFPGELCMTGWRDNMKGQRMQVTATRDIGRWAAEALLRPDRAGLRNSALSIASDELTYAEADRIMREVTGSPISTANSWLSWLTIWAVKDLNTMFRWIGNNPYGADLDWLGKQLEPTTFEAWVRMQQIKE